jgi:4-hydroxy-3-methylbut-2-enyl diphosphate reductase
VQVILAKSAGFCYGVKRAVELAEKTADEHSGCWMLGDLIHNTHVVEDLARRGIRKTKEPESIKTGETVVIRSHGELKQIIDLLEQNGVRCINATCPNVTRIQRLVAQAREEGRLPIIIGEPNHPEVIGIASWGEGTLIFDGPESA